MCIDKNLEYRSSLESFIREQVIGPGACAYQFGFGESDRNESEVINTTPGRLYSSGILFPLDGSSLAQSNLEENGEQDNEVDTEENEVLTDIGGYDEDADFNDSDSEDDLDEERGVGSFSRRYPQSMGMTFCVDSIESLKHLKFTISARHYTPISGIDRRNVYVAVEDKFLESTSNILTEFNTFLHEDGKSPIFTLNEKHLYSSLLSGTGQYKDAKDRLKAFDKRVVTRIAAGDPLLQTEAASLAFYRNRLQNKVLRVENTLQADRDAAARKIEEIEKYLTVISYCMDIIEQYDKNSYGFWMNQNFVKELDLEGIDIPEFQKKLVLRPDSLKDIVKCDISDTQYAAISLHIQLIKDTRSNDTGKIYVKVLLQNTSTPFTGTDGMFYSMVTKEVNLLSFFGCSVMASGSGIIPYNDYVASDDEELDELNDLYRTVRNYGVGHVASVAWNKNEDGETSVYTEFIPSFESPAVDTVPRDKYNEDHAPLLSDTSCLRIGELSTLSTLSNDDVLSRLQELVNSYEMWVQTIESHVGDNGGNIEVERKRIADCQHDVERLRKNIRIFLSGNRRNMTAFRLMNTAMYMQMWHTDSRSNHRELVQDCFRDGMPLTPAIYLEDLDKYSWRPFQLAFVILNLDGIFQVPGDNNWKARNELVDLVWFPTGGGKTEAYLGIIALTIINRRRLHQTRGEGVAVIMRYTLRLLTAQQFQRALRLISMLEVIRLGMDDDWGRMNLGNQQISIGMYTGKSSLPNSVDELDREGENFNLKMQGRDIDTKIPLTVCPICGAKLKYDEANHDFFCTTHNCVFSEENRNPLPVRLCDKHIYRNPPTLLFGTVDKFAALAHSLGTAADSDSRRLLGLSTGCLPPDLIIQDELHLLNGPLGSAVALYENAIDHLCTKNGVRPKIISSTATTRNSQLQIRALYDRDLNIFPHQGIDYDDSFFSYNKGSNRKYAGILPTGRAQMPMQVRLAAILFVFRALYESREINRTGNRFDLAAFGNTADNYHTVISYFNSLKEVGRTSAQFDLEFMKETRRLFRRVLRSSDMLEFHYLPDLGLRKEELTSRKSSGEIVATLDDLEHKEDYLSRDTARERSIDYVMATNMISVGLDVDRMNTMIVNSIPGNVAEYIQSSSRIARKTKGLVLTLFNPAKVRDISFYEKFREFHSKMYYYVEPMSITPFSRNAVAHFLPLTIASIIRQTKSDLARNVDAQNLHNVSPGTQMSLSNLVSSELKSIFRERHNRAENRYNAITPEERKQADILEHELLSDDLLQYLETHIDTLIEKWSNAIDEAEANNLSLVYSTDSPAYSDETRFSPLFSTVESYDDLWTVPMNVRTIDPNSIININK